MRSCQMVEEKFRRVWRTLHTLRGLRMARFTAFELSKRFLILSRLQDTHFFLVDDASTTKTSEADFKIRVITFAAMHPVA